VLLVISYSRGRIQKAHILGGLNGGSGGKDTRSRSTRAREALLTITQEVDYRDKACARGEAREGAGAPRAAPSGEERSFANAREESGRDPVVEE